MPQTYYRRGSHTRTAKYDPVLSKGKREIGNPYIPYTLLSDPPPSRLVIVINWEYDMGN